MSPVMAGLCKYESLIDGTIGLEDVARMNDALIVRAENMRRASSAAATSNSIDLMGPGAHGRF